MDRMKAIFVAGGLTGLVLITVLVLGLRGSVPTSEAASVEAAPVEVMGASDGAAQVQALLEQNRQLRDAVQTMQAREAQYQQQLEAANQTIQALQSQPVAQGAPPYYGDEDGHAEHEHGEYEHESAED